MRVLFIGGTGNISTACTIEALRRGFEVAHLNRGMHPKKEMAGVSTIHADIRDVAAARRALRGERFDAVVQFLAFRPEHVRADIEIFGGITDQYVLISSASVYRKTSLTPVVTEETPLENPFWEYARLKIQCERVLTGAMSGDATGGSAGDINGVGGIGAAGGASMAKAAAGGTGRLSGTAGQLSSAKAPIPYTIVRPSHTYDDGWVPSCYGSPGYGLAWRMLRGLEVLVPGDGQSLWTLTHASDFAVGLVGLLGKREAIGEAFHITSDEHLTWEAIYRIIAGALGVRAKISHIPSDFVARFRPERGAGLLGDKAVSVLFDNAKIRRLVPGFAPRVSFAEGIRHSLAWFDAHPDRKLPDPVMNEDMDTVLEKWKEAMKSI